MYVCVAPILKYRHTCAVLVLHLAAFLPHKHILVWYGDYRTLTFSAVNKNLVLAYSVLHVIILFEGFAPDVCTTDFPPYTVAQNSER